MALRLWQGASLATLFFYPLFSAFSDGPVYLQWQAVNTVELAAAFVLLASLAAALLWLAERVLRPALRALAIVAVCSVPLASFGIHLLRQLGLKEQLIAGGRQLSGQRWLLAAALALALALLLLFALRRPQALRKAVLAAVMVASPVTLAGWANVLAQRPIPIETRRPASAPARSRDRPASVFVFVFDELDYRFLYAGRDVRPRYARLRQFASRADNYHQALAPGDETLTSMLPLVRARVASGERPSGAAADRVGQPPLEGVFAHARRLGYRTVLHGWLHPYCALLGGDLDDCRSFSIYNYSTVADGVSVLSPVFTNVILWPRQLPFGLAKAPVYSSFQRRVVERTYQLSVASFDEAQPLFSLVHFSIPHLPFVYDGARYAPPRDPFLQDTLNYERQLGQVDHRFGRLLDELERRGRLDGSYVVVLSDHAYRVMGGTARSVPLIVKAPFQRTRRDVDAPALTDQLLPELLAKATRSGS